MIEIYALGQIWNYLQKFPEMYKESVFWANVQHLSQTPEMTRTISGKYISDYCCDIFLTIIYL